MLNCPENIKNKFRPGMLFPCQSPVMLTNYDDNNNNNNNNNNRLYLYMYMMPVKGNSYRP